MTEAELIKKIKELKKIQPTKEWVLLTRNRILDGDAKEKSGKFVFVFEFLPRFLFAPALRPVAIALALFVIISGVFVIYPGYQAGPESDLQLANQKLEELNQFVAANAEVQQAQITQAVKEYQAEVSKAAKKIGKVQNGDLKKEIVAEVKKLEENEKKAQSLGVQLDNSAELENALSDLVAREIQELESRTLSQEQSDLLEEAKIDYNNGNYSSALEKILQI